MATQGDGREWPRREVYRQPSFTLHHCNLHHPNTDTDNSVRDSGVEPSQVPWWSSKRLRLSVMCFFGFACLCAQQVNLSISMVCIAKWDSNSTLYYSTTPPSVSTLEPGNQTSQQTKSRIEQCETKQIQSFQGGEFEWNKELQGVLLGAIIWGYLIMQVPVLKLVARFGAKKVMAAGMFPVAILTVLTPTAARASPYLLLAVRIIIGAGQSTLYPGCQALLARWCPSWERSRLVVIAFSGGFLGTALTFPIGGLLCAHGFDGGWASMFYIIGSLGFLWCVVFVIFASDTPDSKSGISDVERKYISHSLEESNKQLKIPDTPWRSILSSGSVWALMLVHMCGAYTTCMLLMHVPSYLRDVIRLDVKSIGVFSMLPYLCLWLCVGVSGVLADFFIFRDVLSVNWTRKVMSLIGLIGQAAFLIGLVHMDCRNTAGAVVLLCLTVAMTGFQYSGYYINHGDIAPDFAGSVYAVTNTAASIMGILAVYAAGAITPNGTRAEWETAFYICVGVNIFGALVFLVFGSGKKRYWARVPDRSKDEVVALRKPTYNGHRKSRSSMRTTYFDNEESHVTIECDPGESYAESACV